MKFIAPRASRTIRIGYVPLADCAPLIVAEQKGFFRDMDLAVKLSREPGWASVREKISHGELDATQAPASMVFELNCGLKSPALSTLTGLVVAQNGNAIALSNELWELGVRDAKSLRQLILKFKGERVFRFACVLHLSSQHYLLRSWLRSGDIDPDHDVEIAIVPPPQVFRCLDQGHLDGYCVAEPWSSVGILKGQVWCAALSSDLHPYHPEKVFLVPKQFHEERAPEHIALLAALIRSATWCDDPNNREELVDIMSDEAYLDLPKNVLNNTLRGPFQMGQSRECPANDVIIFSREDSGRPTEQNARWVLRQIHTHRLQKNFPELDSTQINEMYREDIYEDARTLALGGQFRNRLSRIAHSISTPQQKTKIKNLWRKLKP